jgi:hypothetical protein
MTYVPKGMLTRDLRTLANLCDLSPGTIRRWMRSPSAAAPSPFSLSLSVNGGPLYSVV